jgi:hypothetical protein
MSIKFGAKFAIVSVISAGLLIACGPPAEQVASKAELRPSDSGSGSEKLLGESGNSTFKWDGDSSLSAEQREYLADLSIRYNGIFAGLEGRSMREVEALGFPSAKEWLDAKNLTDDELLNRARQGDVKAKAFYVSEVFQASPAARDEYQKLAIDTQVSAAEILKFHPSPFAAYLFGRTSAVTGGMEFPIAASIAVAGDLGDARSAALLQAYSSKVGAMDPGAVMSSYNSMCSIAGLK